MGMFTSMTRHLDNSRIINFMANVMARNRVAARAYAGLQLVSDEVHKRIDNSGALNLVSAIRPLLIKVSLKF